jgi:hypothetical protein
VSAASPWDQPCPVKVGDKLYHLNQHSQPGPHHVVAILEGEAAAPWLYLVVTKRWSPMKQRWNHALMTPLDLAVRPLDSDGIWFTTLEAANARRASLDADIARHCR